MDIAQYISDLLKEKKEVSIPGIGTLYTEIKSASFHQASNSFFPPSAAIFFRPEQSEPKLLVDYIIKNKNLSEQSARYFAEKFGESLKTELEQKGSAELSSLGTFEKKSDQYNFSAFNQFTPAKLFGLSPVFELEIPVESAAIPSPAVSSEKEEEVFENKIEKPVTGTEDQVSSEKEMDPETLNINFPEYHFNLAGEEAIPEERFSTAKWPFVLLGIAILAAIAVFAYTLYPETFKGLINRNKTADKKPVKVNQPKTINPVKEPDTTTEHILGAKSLADTISEKLEKAGLEYEKPSDTISHVTTEVKTIPLKEEIKYEIISSTFDRKSEADTYIRIMKSKGIDARIVQKPTNKRKFYISLGSFRNLTKANEEKRRIQKEITKEAWILTLKNKVNQ
ncbi:hypothetical protein [Rubrolithibacter danxiaensis]|uniref:HU domain-containing protein n=1 Tax=Rubrolithibacter danxiaensis TaxID=3390805 RepID=UPI003BF868EC